MLNGDESNVRGIESCKEVSAEVHVQVHGGNNRVHDDEEDEESPPEIQIYRTSTTSDDNDDDAEAPPRVVVTTAVSGSPPAPQGTKLLVWHDRKICRVEVEIAQLFSHFVVFLLFGKIVICF